MPDRKVAAALMIFIPLVSIMTGSIGFFIGPDQGHGNDEYSVSSPDLSFRSEAASGEPAIERRMENSELPVSVSNKVRLNNDYFEVEEGGSWNQMKIKGVNMGMAKPGFFPGEASITYDEYSRWIDRIGDMNANTIRTFSVHPPQFYEALLQYNVRSDEPIHLLQGVWVDNSLMTEGRTAFDEDLSGYLKERIGVTMDIIHGHANVADTPGIPSGIYSHDVSTFTLGMIIGVEWDPYFVLETDTQHPETPDVDLEYIRTENASPFEIWLAEMMDHAITYETSNYGFQIPVSFLNYQSLDKMDHPSEPTVREDMVSVDPDNIIEKDNFLPGLFATFHVYPYYPDFMNLDINYGSYIDARGERNNFAGYLDDLNNNHETPVLIGEFGVPSSDGIAHTNVNGMDQGHLTEREQGQMNSKMFLSIIEEGLAGGVLFSWQDEWFKTCWNTVSNINTERNPSWYNSLNCEENYGLMSFEPGIERSITIDGREDDWTSGTDRKIDSIPMKGDMGNVRITNDEGYLYLSISGMSDLETEYYLLLDTIPDQGNRELPGGVVSDIGADYMLRINDSGNHRLMVNGRYDTFARRYDPDSVTNDFNPIRMMLRSQIRHPVTGITLEREVFEIGILETGITDPESDEYDSNADIFRNSADGFIEMRIPWNLLNFKDPGSGEIIGGDIGSSEYVDTINVQVIAVKNDGGSGDSRNEEGRTEILGEGSVSYDWDSWDHPTYHERLKESYYIMREIYQNL